MQTPIALTLAYWENPSRPAQSKAFARRAGLTLPENFAIEFNRMLRAFLIAILQDLREDAALRETRHGTWIPGGPWT